MRRKKNSGTHHDMFPLISFPGHVTVANEMFPHFPWEWKFLSLISPLRYEEHSKCRNEAAESKPCRPSRTFTEPFLRSFFQSTSVLSTSSGWHRQQEWKMVTSLKNKTYLWLNYLQSRRYHLARCARRAVFLTFRWIGAERSENSPLWKQGGDRNAKPESQTKQKSGLVSLRNSAEILVLGPPPVHQYLTTRHVWLVKKSHCRIADHYERKFETHIRQ